MKHIFFIISLFFSLSTYSQKNISIEQADSLIKNYKKLIIVDVRTSHEFKSGHLKNAINIDYKDPEFVSKIKKLKKKKKILLYCRSGRRSQNAMDIMIKEGFKDVYNMKGGIVLWQISYDIEK